MSKGSKKIILVPITHKEMKTSLPSSSFKFAVIAVLILWSGIIVNAQTYTTISNGLWSSASTWQGGNIPSSGTIASSATINIRNVVTYDLSNNISNYGTINISNSNGLSARLVVPTNINFENFIGGSLIITNGEYRQYRFTGGGETGTNQNGSFKNTGGYIKTVNSNIEVANDWINQLGGLRVLKNSLLTIGGNYVIHSLCADSILNSSISIGWHGNGDFTQNGGLSYFQSARFQLAGNNGKFILNNGIANGDLDYITFKNHVTNITANGEIFASTSMITSGVNLDAYCGGASCNYNVNSKFNGVQAQNCSLNYFPAILDGTQGPVKLNFSVAPVLISGTDLQTGAIYKYEGVAPGMDAIIKIDSFINGASLTKIDDNAGGIVGYLEGFQPEVKSGSSTGQSYAVFKIDFKISGSNTAYKMNSFKLTALDIDGNSSLKEFDEISMGPGSSATYMGTTTDIALSQPVAGTFRATNIAGIERTSIDTAALTNMFTVTHTDVSSITLKLGTDKTTTVQTARQYGMYMKGFEYPNQVTLPLVLESFNAALNSSAKTANLKWITSSEINVNRYVVERSTDGINFKDAAIVFSNSASTVNTYSYSDNIAAINSPMVYYRLRMVDNDDKAKYSSKVLIKLNSLNETNLAIQAFPNPAVSVLHITIPAKWQNKKVDYEIINSLGQVTKRINTVNSNQTESINVNQFAPGIYIVKVNCDGAVIQQKFIKQ